MPVVARLVGMHEQLRHVAAAAGGGQPSHHFSGLAHLQPQRLRLRLCRFPMPPRTQCPHQPLVMRYTRLAGSLHRWARCKEAPCTFAVQILRRLPLRGVKLASRVAQIEENSLRSVSTTYW